ncbi:reverse transcriptase domain-containing protein [Tanacetum coccineum]
MEHFYRPSLIGRGGLIVPTTVPGIDFVLKNLMVQLLRQNFQFYGFEGEDANDHLYKYLSITQFIKQNEVSQDIINLNLFPFSLTHEAESWFYTLKTHSIHTWEEMFSKFLSKYFPYSRTLQLRKEILNFRQLPIESVLEAWERFKSWLQKCPDHRILFLNQIRTFYNGITIIDQERLMEAAGDSDESNDDEPSEMIKDQKLIHHLSGSLTPSSDPVGDIHLFKRLLNLNSTKDLPPHHELNNEIFDPEGDILIFEKLLKDDPLEAKNSEIDSLIKGPSDTFLMGDEDIKLNPPMDVDNLVPILRVSKKPLDSLDLILETSKTTITDPLFDFDSEFTLNSDNPILDIQNKESDESKTKTIMD